MWIYRLHSKQMSDLLKATALGNFAGSLSLHETLIQLNIIKEHSDNWQAHFIIPATLC